VNGFTDHIYIELRTTSNYSAIVNLHNSQITTALAKPLPACCVFTSRSLAMTSNSRYSSASRAQVLSSQPPVQNCLTTHSVKVKVIVTLWLVVYCLSVHLGVKPLETHDQRLFFSNWTLAVIVPYVAPSLTRRWVCFLWMNLAFCKVYVSHTWYVIENSSLCTTYEGK
jgi:hypothetical protein